MPGGNFVMNGDKNFREGLSCARQPGAFVRAKPLREAILRQTGHRGRNFEESETNSTNPTKKKQIMISEPGRAGPDRWGSLFSVAAFQRFSVSVCTAKGNTIFLHKSHPFLG